ncbi:hypothetical protein J6590_079157 [Homalodisca vitripennis]|nr:hypothetical protein J6590_079157 [Homalodisca vitripennis]
MLKYFVFLPGFQVAVPRIFWAAERPLPTSGLVLDPERRRKPADGTSWPPVHKLTRDAKPLGGSNSSTAAAFTVPPATISGRADFLMANTSPHRATKVLLYMALIRPVLTYAVPAWYHLPSHLQDHQETAARSPESVSQAGHWVALVREEHCRQDFVQRPYHQELRGRADIEP